LKSNASDYYLEVMHAVYIDACMKCSADVLDLRDLETIRSRVENEGMSFLTITLPEFSKLFERSLDLGFLDPACFRVFHRYKHEALPAFLRGLLGQIFDHKTGKVLSHEPPTSNQLGQGLAPGDISTIVEAIRQICRVFSKVEFECAPKRVHSALQSFYEIEQDLSTFSVSSEDLSEFLDVSSLLWGSMFRDFTPNRIVPKHGPGATAERISGANQKFVWRRWHDRLEPYFPLVDNGYPLGIPVDSEELEIVTVVPEHDEQPVRVVTVPKTLKSPRVIAIEPACTQYVQQGIRDYLYDRLESHWLTRRRINFRNQSINQRLALKASRTGRYATIDLSEASDRVPLSLAMAMFEGNPDLRDSILACRSTRAHLPDDRVIDPLRKFASMGSALCFPVEAMYFYTICVVALLKEQNLSCTQRNINTVSRRVRVYGDDIIVPSAHADAVLDHLQKYNCKVNINKTFCRGSFRESCGVDAYAGYEVTPTYIRQPYPENRRQHKSLISWCATANLFYLKGYWRTTTLMFNKLEKILGPMPYVRESATVLGRYSFLGYESVDRFVSPKPFEPFNKADWDRRAADRDFSKIPNSTVPFYQRSEVRGWIPSPVHDSDELDGWPALMKCFLKMELRQPDLGPDILSQRFDSASASPLNERLPLTGQTLDPRKAFSAMASLEDVQSIDQLHLSRSALHGAVTLKRRWAPAH
jgi:hypothetical protein